MLLLGGVREQHLSAISIRNFWQHVAVCQWLSLSWKSNCVLSASECSQFIWVMNVYCSKDRPRCHKILNNQVCYITPTYVMNSLVVTWWSGGTEMLTIQLGIHESVGSAFCMRVINNGFWFRKVNMHGPCMWLLTVTLWIWKWNKKVGLSRQL